MDCTYTSLIYPQTKCFTISLLFTHHAIIKGNDASMHGAGLDIRINFGFNVLLKVTSKCGQGEARDRTTNHVINGQSALPPEPRPPLNAHHLSSRHTKLTL